MNEGDRALDLWLAERVFGWTHILPDGSGRPPMVRGGYGHFPHEQVPSYTGQCWQLLVTVLQGEPHNCALELYFFSRLDEVCKGVQASVYLGNHTIPDGFAEADTPGLALGRAAEQALGGES